MQSVDEIVDLLNDSELFGIYQELAILVHHPVGALYVNVVMHLGIKMLDHQGVWGGCDDLAFKRLKELSFINFTRVSCR